LEAENTILRHQLGVLHRKSSNRIRLTRGDRYIFTLLYRLAPNVLNGAQIVQPETIIRWHRIGLQSVFGSNQINAPSRRIAPWARQNL